jgi:hypothetical protein
MTEGADGHGTVMLAADHYLVIDEKDQAISEL